MTKNDLIEAGARMLSDMMHRAGENIREHIRDDVMADLRAQVTAMRDQVVVTHSEERPTASEGALGAYDRVLALLGGSNGDT